MARALALLFGIILLLPGVCSLGFMAAFIPELGRPGLTNDLGPFALLWVFCFAVSFGGVLIIRNAMRGLAPRCRPPAAD